MGKHFGLGGTVNKAHVAGLIPGLVLGRPTARQVERNPGSSACRYTIPLLSMASTMPRRPRLLLLAAGLAATTLPASNAADYLNVTELVGLRWEDLGSGDGTGRAARFLWPTGVTVDSQGVIYVADSDTVRRISPEGEVTTVAGRAFNPGYMNGAGISARFNSTRAVVVDGSGNLYVAEDGNHTIRKITPAGQVSTFAGLGGVSGAENGLGADSRFYLPRGMTIDSNGALYVADQGNARIRRISIAGEVSDVYPLSAPYNRTGLEGLGFDPAGNLVASDWRVGRLFKLSAGGIFAAFSGKATGEFSYQHLDGPADQALFAHPTGIAVAGDGHTFVADTRGECIRQVTAEGSVTTLAGKGLTPGTEDGTGDTARFRGPRGVALAPDGSLIVADSENSAIRRVTRDGITTTMAGLPGVPGPVPWGTNDGPALAARFRSPSGVTVAPNGEVFVADRLNHTIRRIAADRSVTTFAGNPGVAGTNAGRGTKPCFVPLPALWQTPPAISTCQTVVTTRSERLIPRAQSPRWQESHALAVTWMSRAPRHGSINRWASRSKPMAAFWSPTNLIT